MVKSISILLEKWCPIERGSSVRIIIYPNSNTYFIFIIVEREESSGGTNKEKLTSMDLGLSKVFAKSSHKTTLTYRTCLFPSSWGLPCRHMLIVYHHEKITNIHDKAIVDFWKVSSHSMQHKYFCNPHSVISELLNDSPNY